MLNDVKNALKQHYYGVSLKDWLIAGSIAVSVALALRVFGGRALRRTSKWADSTPTKVDDVVVSVLASLKFLSLFAIGIWFASHYVDLSKRAEQMLRVAVSLVLLLQIGISVQAGLRTFASSVSTEKGGEARTMAAALAFFAGLFTWGLLFIAALSTLGFEISALLAGLGVGGVAAALAVQNILGDLFASISIYFDRPFDIGDFISVGNDMGTVERIGLRTTRVRALGGEQIVFANSDLTKNRLHNFKRQTERRVVFGFGVDYSTKYEDLAALPGLVKEIVSARPNTRFDRAHFKEFAPTSFSFEVVYFILSADYTFYMDQQQTINLELVRLLAERGITFAHVPTAPVDVRVKSESRLAGQLSTQDP